MTEEEQLAQGLADAGCSAEWTERICALYRSADYAEMLRTMRRARCLLMDAMHESQRRVDRMDFLIHSQETQRRKIS